MYVIKDCRPTNFFLVLFRFFISLHLFYDIKLAKLCKMIVLVDSLTVEVSDICSCLFY